ncbi:MAG: shikimate kinase [Flavobacteriaceae bacterium]|nr:shikimate kinase [Flavobacteriaceae bacterium]
MNIVLLGYMASGKTTIGRVLAKNLGYKFIDLDDIIEDGEKNSIQEIFKLKGEIYFRKRESFYLNKVLSNNDKIVLSLGGGTPCYSNNINFLKDSKNITTIFLKSSIETIVKRLKNEKHTRPLISQIETEELLQEYIGKHLFERIPFYNQADLTVSTDDKTIKEIVETIIFNLF